MITVSHVKTMDAAINVLTEAELGEGLLIKLREVRDVISKLVDMDLRDDMKTEILKDPNTLPFIVCALAIALWTERMPKNVSDFLKSPDCVPYIKVMEKAYRNGIHFSLIEDILSMQGRFDGKFTE